MSAQNLYENERVRRIFADSKVELEDDAERYSRALHLNDTESEKSAYLAGIARKIHKYGIAYPNTGYDGLSVDRVLHRIAVHSDLHDNWRKINNQGAKGALGGIPFSSFVPTSAEKLKLESEVAWAKQRLGELERLRAYLYPA